MLSALNPLQYLPVIGTIYRAVTGDQIPEAVRRIGSLVVSGLLGGPIGIAINLAVTIAEKVTGIDLDRAGQMLLTGKGKADDPIIAPISIAARAPRPITPTEASGRGVAPPIQAWSSAQLVAYGVSITADGSLKRADCSGADVLNALELLRIRAAYGRAANLAT